MNRRSWIKLAVLVGYLAFITISAKIDKLLASNWKKPLKQVKPEDDIAT